MTCWRWSFPFPEDSCQPGLVPLLGTSNKPETGSPPHPGASGTRRQDAHDSAHPRGIRGNRWSRHGPKGTHQPVPLPLWPGTPLTPPTRPRAPPSPPPSRSPRNLPPSPHRPRHPRWRWLGRGGVPLPPPGRENRVSRHITESHRAVPPPAALVPSLRCRDRRSRARPLRQTPRADGSPAGGPRPPPAASRLRVQPQAAPGSRRTAGSPPDGAAPRGKVRGGAARGGPAPTSTARRVLPRCVQCSTTARATVSRSVPPYPPCPTSARLASRRAAAAAVAMATPPRRARLGRPERPGRARPLAAGRCPAPPRRDGISGCGRGAAPPSCGAAREPEGAEGPSADPAAAAAAAMVREGLVRRGQRGARSSSRGSPWAQPARPACAQAGAGTCGLVGRSYRPGSGRGPWGRRGCSTFSLVTRSHGASSARPHACSEVRPGSQV